MLRPVAGSSPPSVATRASASGSSRHALVLAFAASGSSLRQREASLVGLLPPELHTIILKTIPLLPEYDSIDSVVGMVGNGVGNGPGQFKNKYSIRQVLMCGFDNNVWVADFGGNRVHHFKQSGELIKTIGTGTRGNGPGELSQPSGVAVSCLSTNVFVSEFGNNRISEFNQSDGALVRVLNSAGLARPYALCLSPDETILAVVCVEHHCIKLIRVRDGMVLRTIGKEGPDDGQFNYPFDVHFTPDGQQLVVADFDNNRVQCISLDGSFVRKIRLNGTVPASKKCSARFRPDVQVRLGAVAHQPFKCDAETLVPASPRAVVVDVAGNIVVITGKHVKVFSPEGTLLHDRLGGLEMDLAAVGGLAINQCTGMIAVGDMCTGKVYLL